MTTRRLSRRRFLLASAAAGAAAGAGHWLGRRPVRLALVGAGTQGSSLARANRLAYWLGGLYGRFVAVCDVDRGHSEAVRHAHCRGAELYGDYRKVLERDDVEAVLVATPDHWHALIALEAMRAGKAVYCEKPVSLTVAEGQALVRAVRATGAVFLGGTQQRTAWKFRTAVGLVRDGRLGALRRVTVTLPRRWTGPYEGPFWHFPSAPPGLDWDAWLGQAPRVDYCPQRCHGSFRRWYEYSGGQMTDWGAHHLDIVHWALDIRDGGPRTVAGRGLMPHVPNGFNTPVEFTADLDYPGGVRVHVRTHADDGENGLRFEGERGWLFVNRERLEGPAVEDLARGTLAGAAARLHPSPACRCNTLTHHLRHFFACVRHGEPPVADVGSMHRSATACHLVNISLRLGRKLTWDAACEQVVGDAEANALLRRDQRAPYRLPT
jgi:predicted dehydrogenase